MSMQWLACELHTHTFHSDGRQSLGELAEGAARLGFDCIALTDHNTMSGLSGRAEAERMHGIAIIPGMEWTTFHGHMVTIGLEAYADWRTGGIHDIHEGVARVHRLGGLAGLAHPFRIGSPICTGCFWEYEIRDWDDFDYIEVWSGTFPSLKPDNRRAFDLWTDRLNSGVRIAATSGRDWHDQSPAKEPVSATYLGLSGIGRRSIAAGAVDALAAGRVSVTIGPLLTMELEAGNGAVYGIGDICAARADRHTVHVTADFNARHGLWELPEQTYTLKITGNPGTLAERRMTRTGGVQSLSIQGEGLSWIRAELWGTACGARTIIAFTNALYFGEGDDEA